MIGSSIGSSRAQLSLTSVNGFLDEAVGGCNKDNGELSGPGAGLWACCLQPAQQSEPGSEAATHFVCIKGEGLARNSSQGASKAQAAMRNATMFLVDHCLVA